MGVKPKPAVTERQEELLRLLGVKGCTMAEAAKAMYVADSTAANMVLDVKKRLGARTTAHAVYLWLLSRGRDSSRPGVRAGL